MRYGVCNSDPSMIPVIKKYGYDFFEGAWLLLRDMSEEEWESMRRAIQENDLPMEGVNCFAAPEEAGQIVNWSPEYADAYLLKMLECLSPLGLKYIVIGSGEARQIPDGMTYAQAAEKFAAILRRYGAIAEPYGVTIIVEPLASVFTNFINLVSEAADICRKVNHPNVGCLADFFHMAQMKEPHSVIRESMDCIKHIHLQTAKCRNPRFGDEEEVRAMAAALKDAGYDGRGVTEGDVSPDFETTIREFSEMKYLFS